MKKRIAIYGILIFMSIHLIARAQDYKADFAKINSVYNTENNVTVEMSYKYFSSPSDKEPSDSLKGKMVVYRKNYTCRIGNMCLTRNDNYLVTVDNDNKIILLGNAKRLTIPVLTISALDSLIEQQQVSISYTAINADEGQYQINNSTGNAFRYDIYFDRKTFLFKEVDVYYHGMPGESQQSKSHPVLRVYYSNYKKTIPDLSVFSETNYIHIQNKTVVPVLAYRSYKIINNVNP